MRRIFSRRFAWASCSAALLLAVSGSPARADVGVPMLLVMGVPMWASLIVIIPLEAWVARRVLNGDWPRSLRISAAANLVSTVVGVPLTWGLLFVVELGLGAALKWIPGWSTFA